MSSGAPERRRRVLFYSHTSAVSGAERMLLTMLDVLDRERFEPMVACPPEGPGAVLPSLLAERGVPMLETGALQARFTSDPRALAGYLASFAGMLRGFRRMVKAAKPDLLHANSVRAGLVATMATAGMRVPIVWHVQDDLPKHRLSEAIRRLAFRSKRTQLVTISNATTRAFVGDLDFGARAHLLYNGIDLARFPLKTTNEGGLRAQLGLSPDTFLVVAVGLINVRKGLLELIEAWRLVHASAPMAHLALVGAPLFNRDDLYLEELKARVAALALTGCVHFPGPSKDVAGVMRSADLMVLNAAAEPFGLVLVEAMSSGTPVVATRVGGVPEVIAEGVTGVLVGPPQSRGAAEELATAICGLLWDSGRRERLAAAGRQSAEQRFSLATFAKALADVYAQVFRVAGDPLAVLPKTQEEGTHV